MLEYPIEQTTTDDLFYGNTRYDIAARSSLSSGGERYDLNGLGEGDLTSKETTGVKFTINGLKQ